MAYNNWKLMDRIVVAVRQTDEVGGRYDFTGYIVEAGNEDALKNAKDWARITPYDREKGGYQTPIEPKVYEFENKGFIATVLDSAGGSSQGGRLSFWRCKVEKDGVEFIIGVNDAILADVIKNSDIANGKIKQELMFARKGGQPGLIHENMQAYQDATADMKHKAEMKSAKKTKKWEIGGIYQTITQTDICLGEVWDTMEEYETDTSDNSWYARRYKETKLRERNKPVKVLAWTHFYNFNKDKQLPSDFTELLKDEIGDRNYVYFSAGTPPARAKTGQLEVKEADMELLDQLLSLKKDQGSYGTPEVRGRYVREIT